MNLNDNNLEQINVRPLSEAERSRTWARISSQLATTPAVSPFVFPFRTLSLVTTFLIIVGTVRFADTARPGQILFSVDVAVERVETALNPASQAQHASERVAEFMSAEPITRVVADEAVSAPATDQPIESADSAPARMATFAVSTEAPMLAKMATPAQKTLAPTTEMLITTTRNELTALLTEALNRGDDTTASKIQVSIDEFEVYVAQLRSN